MCIVGKSQYLISFVCNKFCLIFAAKYCVFIYAFMFLKPRFKIDVVVMIIWSIVIIINSVLTLQVSTAKPMIADRVE